MGGYSFPGLAVLGGHAHGQRLTLFEVLEPDNADLVIRVDFVVVGGVGECKGKHSLFLEIGFVDPSKGADDDGRTVQVTGFQCCVFSRRTLSVVLITNDDPLDTFGFVVSCGCWDGTIFSSGSILDLVCFTVLSVDGTDKHVVPKF